MSSKSASSQHGPAPLYPPLEANWAFYVGLTLVLVLSLFVPERARGQTQAAPMPAR